MRLMFYSKISVNDWLCEFLKEQNNVISVETKNKYFNWLQLVSESGNYGFTTGITGGAWLLLFLVKFKYLEIDISDYFEDIDDNVYRYTKNLLTQKKDVGEMIMLTHYYQMRLTVDKEKDSFRREALIICFNTLVSFLKDNLSKEELTFGNRIEIILRLSSLNTKLIANKSIIKEYSYAISDCLDIFRSIKHEDHFGKINESLVLELLKLGVAIKNFGNPIWIDEINDLIEKVAGLGKKNFSISLRPYVIAYYNELFFSESTDLIAFVTKVEKQQLFDMVTLCLFSNRIYQ